MWVEKKWSQKVRPSAGGPVVAEEGCGCCHVDLILVCVQFFAAATLFSCRRIGMAKRPWPGKEFFRPFGHLAV